MSLPHIFYFVLRPETGHSSIGRPENPLSRVNPPMSEPQVGPTDEGPQNPVPWRVPPGLLHTTRDIHSHPTAPSRVLPDTPKYQFGGVSQGAGEGHPGLYHDSPKQGETLTKVLRSGVRRNFVRSCQGRRRCTVSVQSNSLLDKYEI